MSSCYSRYPPKNRERRGNREKPRLTFRHSRYPYAKQRERERVASSPSRALRKGSKPLFRGILAVADREAVKSRDSLFAGPSTPQEERRGEESSSSSASRVSYRRLYRCRYVVARRCTRVHVRYKPADLAPTLAHPAKLICLLITGAHTCQFIRRQKTTRERGCT